MKKGFTLIELLIVITIIGILAVVFLPTIMDAPAKARDAQRIANLTSISNAIAAGDLDNAAEPTSATKVSVSLAAFSKYFPQNKVPVDPVPTNKAACTEGETGEYCIQTSAAGAPERYTLWAVMENSANQKENCPLGATGKLCYKITVL